MLAYQVAITRLVLALVLGGLIGLERERGERAAGLRTHALVALGAALIMLVSSYGFSGVLGTHIALDPSRVAAQVVSGIGFLGAGIIFLRRDTVKGLTTAAAIWLVAAIGLACGAGLLLEAISVTVLALIVLALLRPVERRLFPRRVPHTLQLRLDPATAMEEVLGPVGEICRSAHVQLDSMRLHAGRQGDLLTLTCRITDQETLMRAAAHLRRVAGVTDLTINLRDVAPPQTIE